MAAVVFSGLVSYKNRASTALMGTNPWHTNIFKGGVPQHTSISARGQGDGFGAGPTAVPDLQNVWILGSRIPFPPFPPHFAGLSGVLTITTKRKQGYNGTDNKTFSDRQTCAVRKMDNSWEARNKNRPKTTDYGKTPTDRTLHSQIYHGSKEGEDTKIYQMTLSSQNYQRSQGGART